MKQKTARRWLNRNKWKLAVDKAMDIKSKKLARQLAAVKKALK